ncbi:MAG TPA: type II toxin-antitoxin system HicB family antitoxin [Nodularia sp. (in: cyanobacteria)]|nr:type II toxin-antitoxin system HicB family antitoxin [Nodularia sp. (in: cyanobacteria)]
MLYKDEDGYWIVECPSLKGCISQAKTKEEALSNIKEAIVGYVTALEEDGLSVPEDKFETFLVVV